MTNPGPPRQELGNRARKILYAVVSEYVATGEPVGSRTLARRYGLDLSPATIRNVLADLEEMGFLAQPHTSAGRVPTDLGFKLFVDTLLQMREVSLEHRHAIVQSLQPGVDDFQREAGRVLSSLTNAATIVAPPKPEEEPLQQVRFLPLRPGELLAVLITRSGKVQNRAVRVGHDYDASELEHIHNFLNELAEAGRSLTALRAALAQEMARERGEYDQLKQNAKQVLDATIAQADFRNEVYVEGQRVLFDRPEFASSEKIRSFVKAFEEKELLLDLLDRTISSSGVQVSIGAEVGVEDLQDISVISAPYGPGTLGGSVAVVGPTRMDFARVVPLVGFTARVMTRRLDGAPPDSEPEDENE